MPDIKDYLDPRSPLFYKTDDAKEAQEEEEKKARIDATSVYSGASLGDPDARDLVKMLDTAPKEDLLASNEDGVVDVNQASLDLLDNDVDDRNMASISALSNLEQDKVTPEEEYDMEGDLVSPRDVANKYLSNKVRAKRQPSDMESALRMKAQQQLMANLGQAGSTLGAAVGGSKQGVNNSFWDKMRDSSGDAVKLAQNEDLKALRKKEKEDDRAFKKSLLSLKAKHGSKRKLSSKDVTNINEGNTIPNMLLDIRKVISSNKNSFGPVLGRASSYNPYDEKAQTIDSEMRAVSQAFGRYMEGGVLRKEDEEKYRKMFPKLADTPAVAANRLDVVQRLLMNKQKSNLKAYAAQGFDIRGLDMKGKAPELPSIIRGGEGSKTEMANQELGKKAFYASEDKVKRAQALAAKGNVGAIKFLKARKTNQTMQAQARR